jgi:DNA repair protein RecO (recombination protein O)
MAVEKATGIVIRLTDYSETSQIATFLTDRFGKVAAIAKGAKRPKSGTGGAIDMLTMNEILFSASPSGGLANLREARVLEQFGVGRLSSTHYYAGLYFAELADIFALGSEGSSALFDLLAETLRALSCGAPEAAANLVFYFESHVLMVSGLAPNLGQCVHCGRAPAHEENVRISLVDGGILCKDCPGGAKIAPATLAALKRVCESTVGSVQRLRLHKAQANEVGGVLSAMVIYGAHRVPRLLQYVRPDFEKSWKKWTAGAASSK